MPYCALEFSNADELFKQIVFFKNSFATILAEFLQHLHDNSIPGSSHCQAIRLMAAESFECRVLI